ncbi:MAG: DUF1795 domain-containing protein [Candidatus Zixiibacteriota bacterium]|nr:MAG: DUF1795 domain-containing protein [candidate division Zixibacteria bacterium]
MEFDNFHTPDFHIRSPKDWNRQAFITFIARGEDEFPRNVVITQEDLPAAATVEEYARQQRKELENLAGFNLVEEGVLPVQGRDVPYVIYSWRPANGKPIKQFQTYFVASTKAWTITGTALTSEFDSLLPDFRSIAGSFNSERNV